MYWPWGIILRCVAILWLMMTATPSRAQSRQPYIVNQHHLTIDDGLASNTALCGLQDDRGFVWIGTTAGLQRYDGRSFRLFNALHGGLRSDKVRNMATDKDGRLWLQTGASKEAVLTTGQQIDIMDLRTYKVRSLTQSFGNNLPFREKDVEWLFADAGRNLFLITNTGALWWYRGGGSFRQLLTAEAGRRYYSHRNMYQAWGGHVWLSPLTGIIRVDTSGHVTPVAALPDVAINSVLRVKADGSCVGITAEKRMTKAQHEAPQLPVTADIALDGTMTLSDHRLLRAVPHPDTRAYLLEYCADIRTRSVILHNPRIGLQLLTDTNTIQLIDTAVLAREAPLSPYAYFTDAGGGHWLCTSQGVFRFLLSNAHFTNYLTRSQMPAATAIETQVRSIRDDGHNNIYIGRDGLYRLSDSSRRIARLTDQPVTAIACEGDTVWFSCAEKSAVRYSAKRRDTVPLRHTGKRKFTVWTFERAANGRFLAGGNGVIGVVSGDSIRPLPSRGDTLAGTCYQFLNDRTGRTWAVTDGGLFEVKDNCYMRYADRRHPLPSSRLQYIYEAADGNWWLCTNGDGLISWHVATGAVKRFGIPEGLPSDIIYACFPDARGLLWLSSSNGLIRLDPATGSAEVFTKKDGLPDNEFNRVSYGMSAGRRLFFGGLNGFTAFYPDAIPLKAAAVYHPPLQVLSLQQYSAKKRQLVDKTDDFFTRRTITMEPEDQFLMMEVVMLDYAQGIHHYEYRVDRKDEAWRNSGDGIIRLDNVPYGAYTLRIRGQNAQGIQAAEELRIPLLVRAPFYRTPLFIGGIAALALALLYLAIRARVRLLERTNRRLEATIDQRTQELRVLLEQKDVLMKEIHHRVKNNLQMISTLQQMQASRSDDPRIKSALEESQNRVLSIAFIHQNLYQNDDLKGVEIISFVEELITHVAQIYSKPGAAIEIIRDIPELFLDIETAVPLGLIINELLTNAYKYAFAGRAEGRINLSVSATGPGTYSLAFSDNGVGLPEGLDFLRTKSLGLRLINRLSRQIGSGIRYDRTGGSHFRLEFTDHQARNNR